MPKSTLPSLKWIIILSLFFAALSFPIMVRGVFDYLHNGSDWRQGDWLISSAGGFTRRSLIGDGLIWLSDVTGLGLLLVVQLVQTFLFVTLVFALWIIAVFHSNRHLILLLAASPAFFLILWAGDTQGIMRKELLGMLAFAALALAGMRAGRSVILPVLAVLFYTLGCIGNILHIFIAPALLAGFYILFKADRITTGLWRGLAITTITMSALWLWVAIWFKDAPDLDILCAPLLARGFDDHICDGALRWMVPDLVDHHAELVAMATPGAVMRFAIMTVLALIPVALSMRIFQQRRDILLLAALAFIPFLPLYAVATDWGRWVSICYMAYVLLLVLGHGVGRFTIVWMPPRWVAFVLLALALVLSPAHGIGWQPGGVVYSLITSLIDLI